MHDRSVIFQFWSLDPIGTIGTFLLELLVSRNQHIHRESIMRQGTIQLQDSQEILALLLSKQAGALVASLAMGTITVLTLPLFCFLLVLKVGRHRIVVADDRRQMGVTVTNSLPLYVLYERKRCRDRRRRVYLTVAVILAMSTLLVAAANLAVCGERIRELRTTATELTELASERIDGANAHLKDDLAKAVEELNAKVRAAGGQTSDMIESAKDIFKNSTEARWGPLASLSERSVSKCEDTIKKISTTLRNIDEFIPKADEMDESVTKLQDHMRIVRADVLGVPNAQPELIKNIDKVLGLGRAELANAIKPFTEKNKNILGDFGTAKDSFPKNHITEVIEGLWEFPAVLRNRAGKIVDAMKEVGNVSCQNKEKEFQEFARETDTLLMNKTAQRLKLWMGDVFSVTSEDAVDLAHAVLIAAGTVGMVSALFLTTAMVLGVALTNCYDRCNPHGYVTTKGSNRAGNAMVAWAYASSLLLGAYLTLTMVAFFMGVYYVDVCHSYEDKDALDFPIETVVSFGDTEVIEPNRTGKEVIETCESTNNIIKAVGRTDLLEFNRSSFEDIKPDYTAMKTDLTQAVQSVREIDVSLITQSTDKVKNISATIDSYNAELEREGKRGIEYSDEYQIKFPRIIQEIETALKGLGGDKFRRHADELTPKHNAIVFSIVQVQHLIYGIKKQYKSAKIATAAIGNMFQECATKSKNLNDFIGPEAVGVLVDDMGDVSRQYVLDLLRSLDDVLRGRQVDHAACKTLLLAYEQSKGFACYSFLNAVSATWLNLFAMTTAMLLGLWAAVPALYLIKTDKLLVDVYLPVRSYAPRVIPPKELQEIELAEKFGDDHQAAPAGKTGRPRTA